MEEKTKVLVDDDKRMVRTICDILKVKGHEVTEAYTGEEAVEKVKSYQPDCVLMDIKITAKDGTEELGFFSVIPEVLNRESIVFNMFWIPGSSPRMTNFSLSKTLNRERG